MKIAIKIVSIIEFVSTMIALVIGLIYSIAVGITPALLTTLNPELSEEMEAAAIGGMVSLIVLASCIPAFIFSFVMVIIVFTNLMKTVNSCEKRIVWGVLSIIFFSTPAGILYLVWNGE